MTIDFPILSEVTLSADTSILANGDVIADTQVITNAFRDKNRPMILDSVVLIDKDDQKAALDLYFFSANVVLGAENSGPSISDADALNFLGIVAIATGDYKDLGGVSVVNLRNLGLIVKPATDTQDLYVAAVNGSGTPTYTAAGLRLRLGMRNF